MAKIATTKIDDGKIQHQKPEIVFQIGQPKTGRRSEPVFGQHEVCG